MKINYNKILTQYKPYFQKLLKKEFRFFKGMNLLMTQDDFLQEFQIKLWQSFEQYYDSETGTISQFIFGYSPNIAKNVRSNTIKSLYYTGKKRDKRTESMKLQLKTYSLDSPKTCTHLKFRYKTDEEFKTKSYQQFSSDDQINEVLYYRIKK